MRTALIAWALVCLPSVAQAQVSPEDATGAPYFVVPAIGARLDPLPLREVAVHADVSGVVADVSVTQLWENTGAMPIDATYVFPLSTRAAVHALEMRVGGRRIVAIIKEKDEARHSFDEAKRQGKTATLLEQSRPNMFTTQVANIQPGDVIEVELRYVELLRPTDGVYSLVVPKVVGPRYVSLAEAFPDVPWSVIARSEAPPEPTLFAWPVSVSLRGGVPVLWAHSSTHPIALAKDDDVLEVELVDPAPDASRDFVLDYALGGEALSTGVLVEPDADNAGGHFLALVLPPERLEPELVGARDYVFLVDTSGSMEGWPLGLATRLVGRLVDELDTRDRVNVLCFSGGSERLSARSLPATAMNKSRAKAFLARQRGQGGTELLAALETAFLTPGEPGLARTFVLVTDGYVTIEAQAIDLIRARAGDANVFAMGIGDGVNRYLLEAVAHAGGGEPYVAESEAAAAELAERFFDDVRAPVLTDITFQFDGFDAYDVEPEAIPTLYASRPLLVSGRYRGPASGTLVVSGQTGRGPWQARTPIGVSTATREDRASRPPAINPAVPLLWARERIARLSDFGGAREAPDHQAEVTALGLAYHLVTQYTSFVAVDDKSGLAEALPTSPVPENRAAGGYVMGSGSGGLGFSGQGGGGAGVGRIMGLGKVDTGGGLGAHAKQQLVNVSLTVLSLPAREPAPADVLAAFQRRLGAVRACLAASYPVATQTLAWELLLGRDGQVLSTQLVGGVLDLATSRCVDQTVGRIRFPATRLPRSFRLDLRVSSDGP